ncbi:MAG: DUF4132 domain-containing protein, partial [Oscillospiraceae bacterium]|nr:DUF4132 domain-containing protein [Oscillospiraceae bacterium]
TDDSDKYSKNSRYGRCKLETYFGDKAEAEEYYAILDSIRKSIKGKRKEFSPCVFPWHTAKLEKNDIVYRMAYIARVLDDNDKIDEVCGFLGETEAYIRASIIALLLNDPKTKIQKEALTAALCDKGEYGRKYAFDIIKRVKLSPENYLQMEGMLRYKAADARANIISLLCGRADEELYGSFSRLIADKKEEKRVAALDIALRLSKDEERRELFEKCLPLVSAVENPTTKEKILIDNITKGEKSQSSESLFTDEDAYNPELPDNEYSVRCAELFMKYFPDSAVGAALIPKKYNSMASKIKKAAAEFSGDCKAFKQAEEDLLSLDECIKEHRGREFVSYDGEVRTVDCYDVYFRIRDENGRSSVPFIEDWIKWSSERGVDIIRLTRMKIAWTGFRVINEFSKAAEKYVRALFGNGFEKYIRLDYESHIESIIRELEKRIGSSKLVIGTHRSTAFDSPTEYNRWVAFDSTITGDRRRLAFAAVMWSMKAVPDEDAVIAYKYRYNISTEHEYVSRLFEHPKIAEISRYINSDGEHGEYHFALSFLAVRRDGMLIEKVKTDNVRDMIQFNNYSYERGSMTSFETPDVLAFVKNAYLGKIPEKTVYWKIFRTNVLNRAMNVLSNITATYKERDRQVYRGRGYNCWQLGRAKYDVTHYLGRKDDDTGEPFNEEEIKRLEYAANIYEKSLGVVLDAELNRGDSETPYSGAVRSVNRIYGVKNFAAILSALGKDVLKRSMYSDSKSKKGSLSHLLSVCIPDEKDNAEALRDLLKDTDITEKRLIEAALYSPEWLDIVGEYLGWEGFTSACYYFMAHMNEVFDDKRIAMIAKYTPLSDDELNLGAFDIDWFRSAYEAMGEKRFDMIYDAAKYISSGAKHSRARKYADAALGKLDAVETVKIIADKRNKDLLMAYALIPLSGEDDICERYLYLRKFLKESKKFGSQRSAAEKKATETAMRNLALNAGYADITRLTLRMETKLADDAKELFENKEIDGVTVRLTVDENGKADIICEKDGKRLKSLPARIKKNEYILKLTETKKKLVEQYRRTKQMFEQAMEDGIEFTVEELKILHNNPVAYPIIKNLVFEINGGLGFISGNNLADYAGNTLTVSDKDIAVTAHSHTLYKAGHWAEYQKYLFENKIVQPFKQVFRELYVKTDDEAEMAHSLRYAGHQIQAAKTVACLKGRRWVADVENGLQKVYYKENIVAQIFAAADWFSPADIEAPTLEWVRFSDRKTGEPIVIKEIPDIIFSEVMRDVDLAVSVAHAGGVDPETSRSTVEMRAALLEFTLPMFKLKNVEIDKHHAYIDGKLASYTVHLGSGVIHKQGGSMIAILPVHSQHRGKLFLPFADDDPKTAEILTKVLMLAEDGKIKDPSILDQIKR